jgi:hypothetical protein
MVNNEEKINKIKDRFLDLDKRWCPKDKYCKSNFDLMYEAMKFVSDLLEIDKV